MVLAVRYSHIRPDFGYCNGGNIGTRADLAFPTDRIVIRRERERRMNETQIAAQALIRVLALFGTRRYMAQTLYTEGASGRYRSAAASGHEGAQGVAHFRGGGQTARKKTGKRRKEGRDRIYDNQIRCRFSRVGGKRNPNRIGI